MADRTSDPDLVRRLLLAAASSRHIDVAPLAQGVDLRDLARAAEHHGITTLVFARLARCGVELPEALTQEIAVSRVAVRARRLHAQRTLVAMTTAIDAPFLVFKGPVLAARWYDDPDDRDFTDIDVLVRRTDFGGVLADLTSHEFELLSANWKGFLDHEVAELPLGFESSIVDLHWHPIGFGKDRRALRLTESSLFSRARLRRLGDVEVSTFDDVDTLLHLCIHTGLDGGRRLRGLVDIDHVLASRCVDLGEFLARARHSRAQAVCAAVLQRCRSAIGTEIEPSLLRALAPWREWLPLTRSLDRWGAQHSGTESVAPGFLITQGRVSRRATIAAVARRLPEVVAVRAGRHDRADAGGPLDWQRQPPSHDVARQRQAYLEWVGDRSLRARRCRDVDELHRLLGHLQPRTTPMLGAAFLDGLESHRCRADLLEHPDGAAAAVLVRYRWTLGRCTGFPALLDASAAGRLAELVERSDVTDLAGMESDTTPLEEGITRWRSVTEATVASVPPGFLWEDEYDTTRQATRRDLPEITELVWNHAPQAFPNIWLLRRRLKRAIADLALVVEAGDPPQIAGVMLRDSTTPEYHYWAQIVIDPRFRERGLSWHLIAAGAAEARRNGVGGLVLIAASNPMPVPDDANAPESWNFVTLDPPRRVKGERRLRWALDDLIRSGDREELTAYRTPGGRDELTSERRRQAWWSDRVGSRR